ncbi:MAG TPA: type II toxin-antitoxin system VapC family toxin [Candidatus Limnocylindrales bacterium]|nr:type II toxin-antitoxin system VapC family toxin [Candidatus Limnocylindrales bacterium]
MTVREALLDTSAAIALIVGDHAGHVATRDAVRGLRLGLAGHAWFETYSALTRLPGSSRRLPHDAHRLLLHDFPASRYLSEEQAHALRDDLARAGIAGGSVYDALVGAAARMHGLPLLSRDRRAATVYAVLDVDVRLID